jgi:hypothetical protein
VLWIVEGIAGESGGASERELLAKREEERKRDGARLDIGTAILLWSVS